eukprot:1896151-Rhodomonas_salina.2
MGLVSYPPQARDPFPVHQTTVLHCNRPQSAADVQSVPRGTARDAKFSTCEQLFHYRLRLRQKNRAKCNLISHREVKSDCAIVKSAAAF